MKKRLDKYFVHGNNIIGKLNKSSNNTTRRLYRRYLVWKNRNEKILSMGRNSIKVRVNLFDKYLSSIKKEKDFKSQSKLASTVMEEFLYYLFKDLIKSYNLSKTELGGITAYSNLYFCPPNAAGFQENSFIKVNEKDQDFAIYRPAEIHSGKEKIHINVPMVSIECKTYLDKTMLDGSIATAEKIKQGNPYCLFLVVTETYGVDVKKVDPKYSRIDQIYVLRKQKASDPNPNPIALDVVWELFNKVRKHLESVWSAVEQRIKQFGEALP